jgi:hypothetical protein
MYQNKNYKNMPKRTPEQEKNERRSPGYTFSDAHWDGYNKVVVENHFNMPKLGENKELINTYCVEEGY